jgi:hypothetical protein
MSELSKEAAKLHDIYHDYMIMRDVPDMTRESWLEIAAAALELAGEKAAVTHHEGCTMIDSLGVGVELCVYKKSGAIDVGNFTTVNSQEASALAHALLHAAVGGRKS